MKTDGREKAASLGGGKKGQEDWKVIMVSSEE